MRGRARDNVIARIRALFVQQAQAATGQIILDGDIGGHRHTLAVPKPVQHQVAGNHDTFDARILDAVTGQPLGGFRRAQLLNPRQFGQVFEAGGGPLPTRDGAATTVMGDLIRGSLSTPFQPPSP